MDELKRKLDSLRQLKDGGAISEADFEREKQKLLDQLTGASSTAGVPQPGGTSLDLGSIAGQAVFIGPPNRQYRIERSLGKGSFGEVFLAEDVETSRQLGAVTWRAVKVLRKELATDELSRKRLTQEAEQVKALRHKHIVAVYDWSIDPVQDTPFLVMEYLKGRSLSGVLADRLGSGGYTLAEALELLRPVAQALDYAWAEHKLVHRDLKPDNLFISEPGGVIKLLDFGLAARMRSTASNAGIAVLERAGTLDYAPPEAAAKQKAWHPSHDVYSLAVVLYQLLDPEHELPFAQRAPGTPWPAKPESLSEAQWEVLKQGLAYRQEERPPAAGAFLDAFEGADQREAERSETQRKEAEREAREQADRREREEAQRKAREEAERAQQEATLRVQEEARQRAVEEAERAKDVELWQVARKANTTEAYQRYLDGSSRRAYQQAATERMEALLSEAAKEKQARERAEREARGTEEEERLWQGASQKNTVDGYLRYLANSNSNTYAYAAKERVALLKGQEEKKEAEGRAAAEKPPRDPASPSGEKFRVGLVIGVTVVVGFVLFMTMRGNKEELRNVSVPEATTTLVPNAAPKDKPAPTSAPAPMAKSQSTTALSSVAGPITVPLERTTKAERKATELARAASVEREKALRGQELVRPSTPQANRTTPQMNGEADQEKEANCKVFVMNESTMTIVTPYRGGCKNGLADGQGSYAYSGRNNYGTWGENVKGEFRDGKLNGKATTTMIESDRVLEGEFRENRRWNTIDRMVDKAGVRIVSEHRDGVWFATCRSDGQVQNERNCTDRDRLLGTAPAQ